MSNVNITMRVDNSLKNDAEVLFKDLGMSMTTAFNIFLRQSVREQQIPFKITKKTPNATTIAAIEASANQEEMHGPFDSVSDLMESLNA